MTAVRRSEEEKCEVEAREGSTAEADLIWNPVIGCEHDCSYRYAGDMALGKLHHLPHYKDGFETSLQLMKALREFTEVRTKTLRKAWWE